MAKITTWLADASNGITDFFAGNIHAKDELCVGDTCVTPAQFQAMVAAANQSSTGASGTGGATPPPNQNNSSDTATSSPDTTPPAIEVNGDNPAHIRVGDTYNDLGAMITGPQADLSPGPSIRATRCLAAVSRGDRTR